EGQPQGRRQGAVGRVPTRLRASGSTGADESAPGSPAGNAGIANTSPTAGARTAESPLPREGLKGNPGGGLAHGWAAPVPALEWRGADWTPAMAAPPARAR